MITISKIEVTQGGNAIYELPLKQSISSFERIDFERKLQLKLKLESIDSFEKRLEYFNSHVQNLTYFAMQPQIYFDWATEKTFKIYCGCNTCRNKPGFDFEQEKIYIRLRGKEVKRIVKGINAAKTYKDKLSLLFSINGYYPGGTLVIHGNIPVDMKLDADAKMYSTEPVVDLRPKTREEITICNEFVKSEFNRIYRDALGFSHNYKCFDSAKEIERLTLTLKKSLDPHNLLLFIRSRIFTFFNYPQCLKPETESAPVKQLNEQLNQMSLGYSLFPKMILGEEIDLNRILLDESELLRYTHIFEIFKYYEYVEGKINERYKGSAEIQIHPDKIRLLELVENNAEFDRLIKSYELRIKTAAPFTDRIEFLNKEIANVETEYLQPVPMRKINVINEFSLEGYARFAFDSLRAGIDREIEPILNKAKREFVYFRRTMEPDYSEFTCGDQLERIGNDTYVMLLKGVAYLLYHKFLNDRLKINSSTVIPNKEEQTGLRVKQIALIHAYESKQITRDNAGGIAAKYGYTSANSGEGLFQDYTAHSSSAFRKSKPTPCTPKKLRNKIELFESIVEHLTDRAKSRAQDEIKILKTIYDNEYQ